VNSWAYWSGLPMISLRCAERSRRLRKRSGGSAGDEPAWTDAASGEDEAGGLETREGEFCVFGLHDSKKRSIQRKPGTYFVQRWPSPKATKRLRERVRELTGRRQSERREADCCETDARSSSWGNLFPDGECDGNLKTNGLLVVRSCTQAIPAG